jgi:hypothetical protein
LLVVLLGLLVVCVKVLDGWWHGELRLEEEGNWIWPLLFPLLLWLWWRYFSIFGCKQPTCLLPEGEQHKRD